MGSAGEGEWAELVLYPLACGVLWEGRPLKASSLVGRRVLVGRRQAKVHNLLSHIPSHPRIKEAQGSHLEILLSQI